MSVSAIIDHVEVALIELDYLIADERNSLAGQSVDEQDRSVMSIFKQTYKALEVCLEAMNKVKEKNNRTLVA